MFTNGCLETQFDLKGKVAPNFPNYPMVNHHKNPKWWVPKGEGRRGGGQGGRGRGWWLHNSWTSKQFISLERPRLCRKRLCVAPILRAPSFRLSNKQACSSGGKEDVLTRDDDVWPNLAITNWSIFLVYDMLCLWDIVITRHQKHAGLANR
jgi:hypothetical protein